MGRAYDRSGNAKRAGECFELFRKTGWGEARGHAYAAGFWLDHGDVPAAAYHIHEAVRGSPKDAVVLSVLGTMAFREGNFARARELYLASLAEEPRQSVTIEKLAETLDRLGQAGEAAMVRERAKRVGAEAVPPNRSGPR